MLPDLLHGEGDPVHLDLGLPHPARVYDYWLGGKDNFEADRAAAQAGLKAFPHAVQSVRANRAFLARSVRYLAADAGIGQFLDIGAGLPAVSNTHEVAQATVPDSRVVYVDNDPMVLAHARALLTAAVRGVTAYVDADLRDPGKILEESALTLDFTRPVAVLLLGILHFIGDDDQPRELVNSLMNAVPPGSFLVVSHVASDIFPDEMAAFARDFNSRCPEAVTLRDYSQVERFFGGLDLVEPGVVKVSQWRPRGELERAEPTSVWGGVARKPGQRAHRR